MTKDEALQMCLEYIETNAHERRCVRWAIKDALAQPELCKYGQEPKSCTSSPMDCQCAIEAALAQPEQDAAAFIAAEDRKVASRYGYVPKLHPSEWQVANPERPWVGLTDEEQTQVAWSCGAMSADWLDFARAIEAKLKKKNT